MSDDKPACEDLHIGADGAPRCFWCAASEEYERYHDEEWGWPVIDDRRLFEKICLEGFQSGLSWLTILRKREGFREGFHGFEIDAVAAFTEADIERLLNDAGIVRHRGKIEASINNAKRAKELIAEAGSLSAYFWRFADAAPLRDKVKADIPAQTASSQAMAKDLKKRGWKFVGPTTAYAFAQAMGLVNDHIVGCAVRQAVEEARQAHLATL